MFGSNVLGLIFTYTFGGEGIIGGSNMGALPFGAKYDVIDFPLSNMVNSGIKKVGVITDDNYGPLIEHIGSGEEWNLSHKRQGLFILPPYGLESNCDSGRIKSLDLAKGFIEKSHEEYVLLADSETVCNIDYKNLFAQHERTGADITLVCRFGKLPDDMHDPLIIAVDSSMRVRDMGFSTSQGSKTCYSIGMMLIRRKLLLELVADCISRNLCNFKSGLLIRNFSLLKTYAYVFCGFSKDICSEKAYFKANMSLLNTSSRMRLFGEGRPIYTRTCDYTPTRYSSGCKVANSLIGDGCLIEGEVENSLIFHGVHIDKGACVKNCIIMQDGRIKEGCSLNCAIAFNADSGNSGFSNLSVRHFPILSLPAVQENRFAEQIKADSFAR